MIIKDKPYCVMLRIQNIYLFKLCDEVRTLMSVLIILAFENRMS